MKKVRETTSWNAFSLAVLLIIVELFLGEWKSLAVRKNSSSLVPGLIRDITLYYDARRIYESNDAVKIKYVRDEHGYRSKEKKTAKKIFLTIGGSTTDQKYITEGETWQDYLDKVYPTYDFVNGGIDGQSTYGHLVSIDTWHLNSLVDETVAAVIFYVGVNDQRLLEGRLNAHDKPTFTLSSIKNYLDQYSFFYPRLKKIYRSINAESKDDRGNVITLAMHGGRDEDFLDVRDGTRFSGGFSINYSSYKKLFSELISKTRKTFPDSSIIIIQQDVPGCMFTSKYSGIDIHPYKDSAVNICRRIASVYATQDEALNTPPSIDGLVVLPMYLENILEKQDVYDFLHTNPIGSIKIGKYIEDSGILKD